VCLTLQLICFQLFSGENRLDYLLLLYGPGGRHYSDRRCSDNPQSRRPSTFLAPLGICRNIRNWKNVGGGRGVACIESTALIEAPRQFEPHAYWVWLFKLSYQNFEMPDPIWGSNSPLIFGIWFGVFPIGRLLPVGLFNMKSATRRPDCGLSE